MRFIRMSLRTHLLATGVLFLLIGPARADIRNLPLSEAVKQGVVRVEAISKGGYNGQCLHLDVQNLSRETLRVEVDPGLIYRPLSSEYQHLVALGGEGVVLSPQSCGQLDLRTFCGKSEAHSPTAGHTYRFWKQGDAVLQQTLNYLQAHNLEGTLGQSAVWVLTSGHSLSSVWDGRAASTSMTLVTVMARLLHRPIPKFFTQHKINTSGTGPCFVREPERIVVPLRWDERRATRPVHAAILRPDGSVYRHLGNGEVITPANHSLNVIFEPQRDPEGEYIVRLYDDENFTWQQVHVPVEWD
jgi:hypothetical protein